MHYGEDFLIREMRSRVAAGEREAARRALLKEALSDEPRRTPAARRMTARLLLWLAKSLSPELGLQSAPRECEAC